MLNHIHNNHSHNTDDNEQAMGKELRHDVQMSRWIIMHTVERSNNTEGICGREQCNRHNISKQKQWQKQLLSTKIMKM